jgi:hypothetical protein
VQGGFLSLAEIIFGGWSELRLSNTTLNIFQSKPFWFWEREESKSVMGMFDSCSFLGVMDGKKQKNF